MRTNIHSKRKAESIRQEPVLFTTDIGKGNFSPAYFYLKREPEVRDKVQRARGSQFFPHHFAAHSCGRVEITQLKSTWQGRHFDPGFSVQTAFLNLTHMLYSISSRGGSSYCLEFACYPFLLLYIDPTKRPIFSFIFKAGVPSHWITVNLNILHIWYNFGPFDLNYKVPIICLDF